MERPTLEAMLEAATGVQRKGDVYTVAEDHGLSIYVGEPGQAMEISEVLTLKLHATFCEATSREHHAAYLLEYRSLHGLCVRPPSGSGGRRAGFG
jgi:hypothetical protein